MTPPPLNRRRLLAGASVLGGLSAAGLSGCAEDRTLASATVAPSFAPIAPLAPVRASMDRVFDITVCLRPFRAAGSAAGRRAPSAMRPSCTTMATAAAAGRCPGARARSRVQRAMATSPAEIAVIGCGALGLTSAILAQRAGAKVTIYARDLLPETRSSRATGTWTPDSRIALADKAAPNFAALWEQMARTSFKTYRSYLGLPGIAGSVDRPLHRLGRAPRRRRRRAWRSRLRRLQRPHPRHLSARRSLLPPGVTPSRAPRCGASPRCSSTSPTTATR